MRKRSFSFLDYRIDIYFSKSGEVIRYTDKDSFSFPDTVLGTAFRGINKDNTPVFGIVFPHDREISITTIIHECWHLFFFILDYWDTTKSEEFTSEELAGEVYAQLFEHLCNSVLNLLTKVKKL